MIDSNDSDELIEQYLTGELSGELLEEFNKKFATNDQFRKEVAFQKAIIRNIKEVGRKEWVVKLESIHNKSDFPYLPGEKGVPNEKKLAPLKRIYQKNRYFIGIAASILLVIFSTLFFYKIFNKSNTERIFLAYYQPYPDLESDKRSSPSGTYTVRREAFLAYNSDEYLKSIKLFNSILEKEEDEIVLFYLGNAYLSAREPLEAESIFKKYLDQYQEFALESKWYLSLSYLKQGKVKEARKLLEEILKDNNSYSKKAVEILSKL